MAKLKLVTNNPIAQIKTIDEHSPLTDGLVMAFFDKSGRNLVKPVSPPYLVYKGSR